MSTLIPINKPFSSRQFLNTGTGGEDIPIMIESVLESVPTQMSHPNETSPEMDNPYTAGKQLLPLALRPLPLPISLPDHPLSELLSITS